MPTTVVGSCGIAYHLIGSFNFICNLGLYQFGIPPHSGGTRQTRKCNYNTLDELGRYRAFVCVPSSGTTSLEYQVRDNYTYDQSRYGRLDKVVTGLTGYDVETLYSYDAYDRIIQKNTVNQLANRWLNTAGQSLNVNYGYSLAGKNTSVTLPSGCVISYNYTATGMLTGVNLNGSALIRGISYDGANRLTGWLWGTGAASYTQSYVSGSVKMTP